MHPFSLYTLVVVAFCVAVPYVSASGEPQRRIQLNPDEIEGFKRAKANEIPPSRSATIHDLFSPTAYQDIKEQPLPGQSGGVQDGLGSSMEFPYSESTFRRPNMGVSGKSSTPSSPLSGSASSPGLPSSVPVGSPRVPRSPSFSEKGGSPPQQPPIQGSPRVSITPSRQPSSKTIPLKRAPSNRSPPLMEGQGSQGLARTNLSPEELENRRRGGTFVAPIPETGVRVRSPSGIPSSTPNESSKPLAKDTLTGEELEKRRRAFKMEDASLLYGESPLSQSAPLLGHGGGSLPSDVGGSLPSTPTRLPSSATGSFGNTPQRSPSRSPRADGPQPGMLAKANSEPLSPQQVQQRSQNRKIVLDLRHSDTGNF